VGLLFGAGRVSDFSRKQQPIHSFLTFSSDFLYFSSDFLYFFNIIFPHSSNVTTPFPAENKQKKKRYFLTKLGENLIYAKIQLFIHRKTLVVSSDCKQDIPHDMIPVSEMTILLERKTSQ